MRSPWKIAVLVLVLTAVLRKACTDQEEDGKVLADGQLDKEARKKAKKERDLQRKRENAAKAKKSD